MWFLLGLLYGLFFVHFFFLFNFLPFWFQVVDSERATEAHCIVIRTMRTIFNALAKQLGTVIAIVWMPLIFFPAHLVDFSFSVSVLSGVSCRICLFVFINYQGTHKKQSSRFWAILNFISDCESTKLMSSLGPTERLVARKQKWYMALYHTIYHYSRKQRHFIVTCWLAHDLHKLIESNRNGTCHSPERSKSYLLFIPLS